MKTKITKSRDDENGGFSRIDLLVVICILAVLMAVKFSSVAGSKAPGQSVQCMNNLRQLGLSLLMYSAENNGLFPERRFPNSWPERLRPYYKDLTLLQCPIDGPQGATYGGSPYAGDSAPRSYIFNGWNDYFYEMAGGNFFAYIMTNSMPEAAIPLPRETIIFGEKFVYSFHMYMDILEGDVGNDISEVDQEHHFRSSLRNSGGSNYSFADGSVRFLAFGCAISPENLWAVREEFRGSIFFP